MGEQYDEAVWPKAAPAEPTTPYATGEIPRGYEFAPPPVQPSPGGYLPASGGYLPASDGYLPTSGMGYTAPGGPDLSQPRQATTSYSAEAATLAFEPAPQRVVAPAASADVEFTVLPPKPHSRFADLIAEAEAEAEAMGRPERRYGVPAPAPLDEHEIDQRFVFDDTPFALRAALEHVVKVGGSDLHISADSAPLMRVDGALKPIPRAPVWDNETVAGLILSIMSTAQHQQFQEALELDFAYGLTDQYRFRVNVYQQREAMGAAFRLIPTEIKTLDELGVPPVVSQFAQLPRGLVLVTGPTGSGKSTTLAALIDLANTTRAEHIMTVEDPIEFIHQNKRSLVNQREVGSDTHSFANALKHVLRQDPDIILVGEMRDLETISVALTAAETGHLVFATLHTQSAPQTVDRIIDVFPPHQQGQVRAQLASTLRGVICQTLVPRASGGGRVVAAEVMVSTPAVANLIREGKTYQIPTAMQAGGDLGMHTLDQHLADLVNFGVVTYDQASEKVHDESEFARLANRVKDLRGDAYSGMGARA